MNAVARALRLTLILLLPLMVLYTVVPAVSTIDSTRFWAAYAGAPVSRVNGGSDHADHPLHR